MKRAILFITIFSSTMLLAAGLLSACSSDDGITSDSENQGETVLISGVWNYDGVDEVRAIYAPLAYEDLPQWIKKVVDAKGKEYFLYLYIFKGKLDGKDIYLICSELDSVLPGKFYDKDGKYLEWKNVSLHKVTNWKAIYYYRNQS